METKAKRFLRKRWKLSKTLFTKALETQQNAFYESVGNSAKRFLRKRWKLSKTLFTKALETQQNAFYESVLGSSYWYFMKIESDSVVSQ
ncbi:hypothetical protein LEP1GSC081_3990 [Leptospira kirschneri str. H1]|uniref:Uncharacterized protein n=1 Tax=Leptospira kirschneri str. H1 TaxID=1049966 RepID=A0A0E2B6R4_9LEPT|nr:hypothetical protein LEP1GSC081_3990 [Leptospira kirschneri str. H1]